MLGASTSGAALSKRLLANAEIADVSKRTFAKILVRNGGNMLASVRLLKMLAKLLCAKQKASKL